MTKQPLLLIILILGLSCNSVRQESQTEESIAVTQDTQLSVIGSDRIQEKAKENIRFDFTAGRINTFKETIEIKATLYNDNADIIYFLSSSCDGEQYSLRYDTGKFVLTPFLNCNANYPRIMKIAPKGEYDFQAHFRCSSNETKIKLGFDFYSVDKSFDLNKITLADIHGRKEKLQTTIWVDEKTIK
jgi:hypothetical protein